MDQAQSDVQPAALPSGPSAGAPVGHLRQLEPGDELVCPAFGVVPGAADEILRTLDVLGLAWDGPVVYQSQRHSLYQEAIARLAAAGLAYPCS